MYVLLTTRFRPYLAGLHVVALCLMPFTLMAQSQDAEPELGLSSNVAAIYPDLIAQPATVALDDLRQQLTITFPDQRWRVQLEQRRLLGGVAEVQKVLFDVPEFFAGTVNADADSWVRLTRTQPDDVAVSSAAQAVFSGHVFTAGTLYELRYREDMGGHTVALVSKSAQHLPSITAARRDRNSILAPRAIKIGIAVDSLYNEYHNGRGLAHALGIINGVDGLYQSQLGLAIVVENFRVYDDADNDPLRDSEGRVEQLLSDYRTIRSEDTELPADLALVHLFSGHDDPDKVIGLGWISSACRQDGFDLSMSTPFPYDMLLAAHEIAHNLGARHDDDTHCNSDTAITGTEVMWSELSGNTRPSFSSCSLNEMRNVFDYSCVADNIDTSIALMAEPTGNSLEQHVRISATNNDQSRNATLITSVTTFPINTRLTQQSAGCSINQSILSCQHGTLMPGQPSTISVTATFESISNSILSTELIATDFIDTRTTNNRAALQIDANNTTASTTSMSPASASADQTLNDADSSGGSAGIGSISLPGMFSMLFSALLYRRRRNSKTM